MGDDVPDWILTTQEQLGALITKPTLSVKLLSKPPFKYLYDIVAGVEQATGWGKGLVTGVPADKEAKLAFVTNLVNLIALCLEEELEVNPVKVVCGLEPEQTNVMLQQLVRAATDVAPATCDALLARVVAGETIASIAEAAAERAAQEQALAEQKEQERLKWEQEQQQKAEEAARAQAEVDALLAQGQSALQTDAAEQWDAAADGGMEPAQEDAPTYQTAEQISAAYAELEERARRNAELAKEKAQAVALGGRPELDEELGKYLLESSSDDSDSEEDEPKTQGERARLAQEKAQRLLDELDAADFDNDAPVRLPKPEQPEDLVPAAPEEPDQAEPMQTEEEPEEAPKKKKKKKRTPEEKEARRKRKEEKARLLAAQQCPESKGAGVTRAILLEEEEKPEEEPEDKSRSQQSRTPDEVFEALTPEDVKKQFCRKVGPHWWPFLLNSPPSALNPRQVLDLLREALPELIQAVTRGAGGLGWADDDLMYTLPDLGGELSSSFPNDWVEFLVSSPVDLLFERYEVEPVVELFQALCMALTEKLEDEGQRLPMLLQYEAPTPEPSGPQDGEEGESRQQHRQQREDGERSRFRQLGATILAQ